MDLSRLVKIEVYTNDNKEPKIPVEATIRYVTVFKTNGVGIKKQYQEYSDHGWDIYTTKPVVCYYDKKSNEEFHEEDHPRDNDGKFTDKGGSTHPKVEEFKSKIKERVKTNPTVQKNQQEVVNEILGKANKAIDELGIRDKIESVELQGSFAKGTDLPTSGSDLDLFVMFKTDIPKEERNELGIKIGMKTLEGKNPYIQSATSKYAEAFFEHNGQKMEVQVVPTRHLTIEQIRNKDTGGEPIGMERTPHHTRFMKEALKGKEEEVKVLKQFMKDTGLYDSSMKSQGFSGFSTEVLIHNFGSFENVMKFFADFKVGTKVGEGTRNEDNIFSLMDPIDPNRDLITAFSPMKIARTIKVAKHFLEHGEPPKRSEPVELDSVTISYNTTQENEDTLVGQARKTQNSIVSQLKRMGFDIPVDEEKVTDDFIVKIPRTKMDRDDNKVSLTFGSNNLTIPETYKDKGVPLNMEKAVQQYKNANPNSQFIEEEGRLKAIKKRPFIHLADAVKYLVTHPDSQVQQTGVTDDMKMGVQTSFGRSKFENLI